MANLFYGVSVTQGDIDSKDVTIYNPLSNTIEAGDLLAVYFAHGNTVVAPHLNISGLSSTSGENEETDIESDNGVAIKTLDTTDNVDYMWQSGEMCLFVLTSQQFNSDVLSGEDAPTQTAENDTLYYELIRGGRAGTEYYGLTRLFTDEFPTAKIVGGQDQYTTFEEWLRSEDTETDKTTAATPWLIRQLSEYLIGKLTPIEPEPEPTPEPDPDPDPEPTPEPEPEPEPTPAPTMVINYSSIFAYDDTEGATNENVLIGKLWVGPDTYYNVAIPQYVGPQNTSELINDADIYEVDGVKVHRRVDHHDDPDQYSLTADKTPDSNKKYYEKTSEDPITFTEVTPKNGFYDVTPAGGENPQELGWYEVKNTDTYHLATTEIDIDPTKEYYKNNNGTFEQIEDPSNTYERFRRKGIDTSETVVEPEQLPVWYEDTYEAPYQYSRKTQQLYKIDEATGQYVVVDESDGWYEFVSDQPKTWRLIPYYTKVTSPRDAGWYTKETITEIIPSTDTTVDSNKQYKQQIIDNPNALGWYEYLEDVITGDHFITNVLDENLYFYQPEKQNGIYITKPAETTGDVITPVEGALNTYGLLIRDESLTDNQPANTTLLNPGFKDNPLNIYGNPINILTNNDLNFTFGESVNESKKTITAPSFIENNIALKDKYSHKLVPRLLRVGQGTKSTDKSGKRGSLGDGSYFTWENDQYVIGEGCMKDSNGHPISGYADTKKTTGHIAVTFKFPHRIINGIEYIYKPIGTVGWNISYIGEDSGFRPKSSSSTMGDNDGSWQNLWELYLTNIKGNGQATLIYDSRNYGAKPSRFMIDVRILCEMIPLSEV